MTVEPITFTLSAVLESLRRQNRREGAAGELLANASWWLDTRTGTPRAESHWALQEPQIAPDPDRTREAAYLAAFGFLSDLGVLSPTSLADACLRVLQRSPHTRERTGYADDPLIFAGIWLLARKLTLDACNEMAREAARIMTRAIISPSIAVLYSLIDAAVLEGYRPFAVRDVVDRAVIVLLRSESELMSRLYPHADLEVSRTQLMATACSEELDFVDPIDGSVVLIALQRAIGVSAWPESIAKRTDAPPHSSPIHSTETATRNSPTLVKPIRVLFLAANPRDRDHLRLDEEVRAIEERIRRARHRDAITVIAKWAVRPDDLQEALMRHQPHIVHFSGNGQTEGIELVGDDGKAMLVPGRALAGIFKTLKDNIRLVVFNACFSQEQARAVTQHIDIAIGMREAIGEVAAIAFASSFYMALAFGRPVQDAFGVGVGEISIRGIPEDDQPVLLYRHGVDPSKLVMTGPAMTRP